MSRNKVLLNVREMFAHDARHARVVCSLLPSLLSSLAPEPQNLSKYLKHVKVHGGTPEVGPDRGLYVVVSFSVSLS